MRRVGNFGVQNAIFYNVNLRESAVMSIIELELNLEAELVESTDNQEISRGRISDVREKYDFRVSAYFTFKEYYRVTNTLSLCH